MSAIKAMSESCSSAVYPDIKEFEPLTSLLASVPRHIQKGLQTYEVIWTCVDVTDHWIVVGTDAGIIYVYSRLRETVLHRLTSQVKCKSIHFCQNIFLQLSALPSVRGHCWLGIRKGIQHDDWKCRTWKMTDQILLHKAAVSVLFYLPTNSDQIICIDSHTVNVEISLSVLTAIFRWTWVSWCLLKQRMMEVVVVTTGLLEL